MSCTRIPSHSFTRSNNHGFSHGFFSLYEVTEIENQSSCLGGIRRAELASRVKEKRDWPGRRDLNSGPPAFKPAGLSFGSLPFQSRLSRCKRYRGITGIESQENRSIYRQFDV